MRKVMIVLVFFLVSAAFGSPVAADTACFDWSCNESTRTCTFDFSCSSASPFIWKYAFDFGDGTSTGLTGATFYTHQYSSGVFFPVVTLSIMPWSDNGMTEASCQIVVKNPFGPPLPTSGRCSASS